jgi:hypothetical protein
MNFAVIIPTRDRPKFFEHCKEQLAQQTVKPSKVYAITYPPETEDFDLCERVKVGVQMAKGDGIDLVFIVEDDDKYPENYFERFAPFFNHYEFFGDDKTCYYHLKNKTYRTWHHPYRASLFTTGFKISALNNFDWPADNERFLDIKLWNYARHRKKKFVDTGAIGIKHSIGKCGGKGHYMRFKDVDVDLKFLESKTNGSFEFYKELMKTL